MVSEAMSVLHVLYSCRCIVPVHNSIIHDVLQILMSVFHPHVNIPVLILAVVLSAHVILAMS